MHLTSTRLLPLALLLAGCPKPRGETGETAPPVDSGDTVSAPDPSHVILAWPTQGMHSLDPSYATASIGAPAVGLRAQVLERGLWPSIVTADLQLDYSPLDPAQFQGASDFWEHARDLLGDDAPTEGMGLSGAGLEGTYAHFGDIFRASGVPVVPTTGSGDTGPFPLFTLSLSDTAGDALVGGVVVAPSSTDLGCGLCHGDDYATDILHQHDARHDSTLATETPVRCGACHAQPTFGWEGDGDAAMLATAMHGAHAARMVKLEGNLEATCLACHPGPDTPFLRDTHVKRELSCVDCHGDMATLTAVERVPWQDLPRCETCHVKEESTYQQPGASFEDSMGHGGMRCTACHHVAHALFGSEIEADNTQNLALQGYAGVVSTCTVCHDPSPGGLFPHRWEP